MDLKARTKQKSKKNQIVIKKEALEPKSSYTHLITIQCNILLYTTLQNTIQAMHTAGDFTYTSVADLIRSALMAYQKGMKLTETPTTGAKKQTSIRVNESLCQFYKGLPDQMRSKILERVIRTFMKESLQ